MKARCGHRQHEDQSEQALCLSVVTNAIVAWTTEYLGLAVAELRSGGRRIDDEVLAHVSPAHNENIGFYGTFSFGWPPSSPSSSTVTDRCARQADEPVAPEAQPRVTARYLDGGGARSWGTASTPPAATRSPPSTTAKQRSNA